MLLLAQSFLIPQVLPVPPVWKIREHSAVLQESKAQKLLFECLHLKNYIIGYPEKKVHPDFSNLLWKRKLVRKIESSKTQRWHENTLDLRSIVL